MMPTCYRYSDNNAVMRLHRIGLCHRAWRQRGEIMKLYMHPASTTSRTVALFVADNNLPVEFQVVDLFTGEHAREPYASINPNKMIPVLDDDGFVLSESSAILKYLAEKFNSPAYPKDLQQ